MEGAEEGVGGRFSLLRRHSNRSSSMWAIGGRQEEEKEEGWCW